MRFFRSLKYNCKSISKKLLDPSYLVLASRRIDDGFNKKNMGALISDIIEISEPEKQKHLINLFKLTKEQVGTLFKKKSDGLSIKERQDLFLKKEKIYSEIGKKQLKNNLIEIPLSYSYKTSKIYDLNSIETMIYNKHNKGLTNALEIFSPNGESRKTIIYFNGNRTTYIHRIEEVTEDCKKLNCNAILFDYPSVGFSSGIPKSQNDLVQQGMDIVRYLMQIKGIKPEDICFNGFSLGSAVAILTAEQLKKEGIQIKVFSDRGFSNLPRVAVDIVMSTKIKPFTKAILGTLSVIFAPISIPLILRDMYLINKNWKLDVTKAYKELEQDKKDLVVIRASKEKRKNPLLNDGTISHKASLYKSFRNDEKKELIKEIVGNLQLLKKDNVLENIDIFQKEIQNIQTRKVALIKIEKALDDYFSNNLPNTHQALETLSCLLKKYQAQKQAAKEKKLTPQKEEYTNYIKTCKNKPNTALFKYGSHIFSANFLQNCETGKTSKQIFYDFVNS